ncbi:NUDIX domain-containing protein [Salmonella enterica]|nr:NUDIX domain-containing protein [Salmonella enterica]
MLTLTKSWVKGFMRKDGAWVKPHNTSVQKKAEPLKPVATHKKLNDEGKRVAVKNPTQPSGEESWVTPHDVATFVPEGNHPRMLGRTPLTAWKQAPKTKQGWNYVEGINTQLDEKPMDIPKGLHPAAGVIVEEEDGRIWLVTPTNSFGGYQNTFPKGTCEAGLSIQANAIKEAWEESGLKVEITGVLGDFKRTTSVARMYIARRTGGNPVDMGWESQAVRLVPKEKLLDLLNMSSDKEIVEAYLSSKKD